VKLQCFKSAGPCRTEIPFKPKQVFAAYPFEPDFHWLFDEIIKPVIEDLRGPTGRYNLKLRDARAQTETRDFMCSIAEEVWSSRFGIIDLSKQNANVSLELGLILAHAQTDVRRKFVIISSFEERLPADIASINVVKYDWHDLSSFRARLEAACLETFKNAAPAAVPRTASPLAPVTADTGILGLVPQGRSNLFASNPEGITSEFLPGFLSAPRSSDSTLKAYLGSEYEPPQYGLKPLDVADELRAKGPLR
jgi:hypothetical protein